MFISLQRNLNENQSNHPSMAGWPPARHSFDDENDEQARFGGAEERAFGDRESGREPLQTQNSKQTLRPPDSPSSVVGDGDASPDLRRRLELKSLSWGNLDAARTEEDMNPEAEAERTELIRRVFTYALTSKWGDYFGHMLACLHPWHHRQCCGRHTGLHTHTHVAPLPNAFVQTPMLSTHASSRATWSPPAA